MRKYAFLFATLLALGASPAVAAEFSLTSQHAKQKSTMCVAQQGISVDDAVLKKIVKKPRKLKIGNSSSLITVAHGRLTERASTSKKNVCINKFKRTANS